MGQIGRPFRISTMRRARETGQTFAEYAVALGVITVGIVLALTAIAGAAGKLIARAAGLIPV